MFDFVYYVLLEFGEGGGGVGGWEGEVCVYEV